MQPSSNILNPPSTTPSASSAMFIHGGPQAPDTEMKGTLYKWTNVVRGYQKRWFVLSKGLLSYYSRESDVKQECRGWIKLASAKILKQDSLSFVVQNGDQTFYLKAKNERQRQNWVTALQCSKMLANRLQESEDEYYQKLIINSKKSERPNQLLEPLTAKLHELKNFNDLIIKHGSTLQKSSMILESIENPAEAVENCKIVNEHATIFRVTTIPMLQNCEEFVSLANNFVKKMEKLLNHERDTRHRLEEMCSQLARQYSHLEDRVKKEYSQSSSSNKNANSSDEDEFFEDAVTDFEVPVPGKALRTNSIDNSSADNCETPKCSISNDESSSNSEGSLSEENETAEVKFAEALQSTVQIQNESSSQSNLSGNDSDLLVDEGPPPLDAKRRTAILDKLNQGTNLWAFLKNCVGKELTKIPMPVNFNEPLSMLQRMTEDFEYAHLLHKAAKIDNSCDQLVLVAGFAVSSYSTTGKRTCKPFNPLLCETYECDRTSDLGWKCISEQVSHHPPVLAMHCEAPGWKFWSEFSLASKFRGKYLQVNPVDINHLEFTKQGYHYTWHKVTTTVHNIIVGKLWVDNHGDMVINNHITGDRCLLRFSPYSYFSRETPRKVTGSIVNGQGELKWIVQGTWDDKIEASRVTKQQSSKNKLVCEASSAKVIWQKKIPPPRFEKMYNLTPLAVQLNEPEDLVAPTDSRLRPDQRLMEEGKWDEANQVKAILEEKQRQKRRKLEQEALQNPEKATSISPSWFKMQIDPTTNNPVHVYTNEYWSCKEKQDWSRCPEIFSYEKTE
ncbi:oxysterol binding protein [Brevipalpus obovatus]|uniref:oxysterol binding protein n=1 Tax=Brevipalpus obovatus TaxID=246614 RepID=UPI003D9F848B